MPRKIDVSRLSYNERMRYLDGRQRAKERREKNAADNSCINETLKRTHGVATHGRRCYKCYLVHSGQAATMAEAASLSEAA